MLFTASGSVMLFRILFRKTLIWALFKYSLWIFFIASLAGTQLGIISLGFNGAYGSAASAGVSALCSPYNLENML